MTPKRQRLYLVLISLGCFALAFFFIARAFNDNLVFFFSPSEIIEKNIADGKLVRIGGVVEPDSLQKNSDGSVNFKVTDYKKTIEVHFGGMLPDLFREGQGVVAEGYLKSGRLEAKQVLAKHDERYMPPEVARALKKSGRWREEGGK